MTQDTTPSEGLKHGPLTADWIVAPDGGWPERPVSGETVVQCKWRDRNYWLGGNMTAPTWGGWTHKQAGSDIIAFRPIEAQPPVADGGGEQERAIERLLAAVHDLAGEHEVMAGPFDASKWKVEVSAADVLTALSAQPAAHGGKCSACKGTRGVYESDDTGYIECPVCAAPSSERSEAQPVAWVQPGTLEKLPSSDAPGLMWPTNRFNATTPLYAHPPQRTDDLAVVVEALRKWKCGSCSDGTYLNRTKAGNERVPCKVCGGSRLNPVAAEALHRLNEAG